MECAEESAETRGIEEYVRRHWRRGELEELGIDLISASDVDNLHSDTDGSPFRSRIVRLFKNPSD